MTTRRPPVLRLGVLPYGVYAFSERLSAHIRSCDGTISLVRCALVCVPQAAQERALTPNTVPLVL